jgi:hypothetical protein
METNGGTIDLGVINITYECEKCGTQDNFQIKLRTYYSNVRGNRIGPGVLLESKYAAEKELWARKDYLLNSNEGIVRACPKCGRTQSWMSEAQIKRNAVWIFWGLFSLPFMLVGLALKIPWSSEDYANVFGSIMCLSMIYLLVLLLLKQKIIDLVENYFREAKEEDGLVKNTPVKEWSLEKK